MDSHHSIDGSETVGVSTSPPSPHPFFQPASDSGPGGDLFKWHGTQLLFLPLLISVGVPGNMLVLHVYRTRWPSCTYSLFVRVLACLDLCNCLVTMPLMLIHFMVWSQPGRAISVVRELARAPRYFAYALTFASNVVLLVIAIDRYIKICWPMKEGIKARLAKRLCIGLALTCFILTIPAPLLTRGFLFTSRQNSTVDLGSNATNFSRLNSVLVDPQSDSHVTSNDFNGIASQSVFNGGSGVMTTAAYVKSDVTTVDIEGVASSHSESTPPVSKETPASYCKLCVLRTTYLVVICLIFALGTIAIMGLYSLVWRALKTRKRISMIQGVLARKNSRVVMERTAARSARVFGIVTAAFFLLHLPHFIVLALYVIDQSIKEDVGHVSKAFLNLAELSPFINSVINPFIYSFTSPRFRRESQAVLSRCCCCCLEQFRLVPSSLWTSQRRKSELVTEEIKAHMHKKESQTTPCQSQPEQTHRDQLQPRSSEIQCDQNPHSETQPCQSQSNDSQPCQSQPNDTQTFQSQPNDTQTCPSQLNDSQTCQFQPNVSQTCQSQPNDSQTSQSQPNDSQACQFQSKDSQMCQSQPKDSQFCQSLPKDSQTLQSQPNDSQVCQSQPNDNQTCQSQPKDSQAYQSQPNDSQACQSQPNDSQACQSQPNDSQGCESQPKDSQTCQSQLNDSQTCQSQPNDTQTYQSQPKDSQTCQFQPNDSQTCQSQPNDSQTCQSQANDTQTCQSQPKDSQTCQSQPNDSQTCQSQPNDSQTCQSQPNATQTYQSQPKHSQTCQSQAIDTQTCQSQPKDSQMCQSQPNDSQTCQSQPNDTQTLQSQPNDSQACQSQPNDRQTCQSQPNDSQTCQSQPYSSQTCQSHPGEIQDGPAESHPRQVNPRLKNFTPAKRKR